MECRDIRDRLSAYLEGDLLNTEDALVRDHLAACVVCRREAEGLRRTLAALHQLEETPAPETLAEDVRREVRRKKTESASRRRRAWAGLGWAWGVPVQAAAMVTVVSLALYLTRNPAHAPERGSVTVAQRESTSLRGQPPEKPPEKPPGKPGGGADSRELATGADRVAPGLSPGKVVEEPAKERQERKKAPADVFGTAKKKVPPKAEAPVPESVPPAEEAVSLLKKEKAQEEVVSTAPAAKAAAPAPPVAVGEGVREEGQERRAAGKSVQPVPEKDLRDEGTRLPPVASTSPAPAAAPASAAEPVREWVVKAVDLPAAAERLRTALADLGGEVLEDDGRTIVARLPGTRMGRLEEILAEGGETERKPARSLSGSARRDEERSKGSLAPGRQRKVQGDKRIRVIIRLVPREGR
jgi:hypothetical protein